MPTVDGRCFKEQREARWDTGHLGAQSAVVPSQASGNTPRPIIALVDMLVKRQFSRERVKTPEIDGLTPSAMAIDRL
jgi:hypothetical protein